jgi:hypothetical protein
MGDAVGAVADLRHYRQGEILMKCSLLLFLSTECIHAQRMENGRIVEQRDFSDSQEGRENFSLFLEPFICPAYLLTDMIEEDFRHEIIPHLIWRSRKALLMRKFEQFYRGTPFHYATLLQRQDTGRRDDDMLFSALTNPSLITPWLDILLAQQIPLAGIYSVPQISTPLIKDHPANHLLLISWEKTAGLRQTYFIDHRLHISRLTPVHAELTFQDAVVKELSRTYQYLKSLSLLPSGQTLDVRLLGNRHDLLELQLKLPRSTDMRYDFVDLADIAKQLEIDHPVTDSDATQIFLYQLAASPPKANYAGPGHTRYFAIWQLQRALNWAAAALLLGSLLWAVTNVWQSSGEANEAASLRTQAQHIESEIHGITRNFPNTLAPASDMKAAVSVMRKLEQSAPIPIDVLRPISAALDRHPRIELGELAWRMDATEPVAANTQADVPAQIVTIKGNLVGFAGDYRAALHYLESFQRDLTAQGYQVTVLSRPLDVSPSGNIDDLREADTNALSFSVRLSRRPPQ